MFTTDVECSGAGPQNVRPLSYYTLRSPGFADGRGYKDHDA